MKKIFIYFSLTGSGDVVSDYMKKNGYDIRKVISKNKYPKKMFPLMMVGGFKALTKMKDKLIDFDSNIDDYDEVVIGTPIWFDRVSSPINSVLSKLDLSNKKVSFILYSASGDAKKATERLKDIGDITILKEPKKYKEELNKIRG
jgi:multimeric flavodoxin WrbA